MPSTATDRLDGLTTSVAVKAPCKAYTTSTITQSGEQTIGGVACVDGDRYILDDGTTAAGIWVVRTGAHERAKDFDGNRDVVQGTIVNVVGGNTNLLLYRVTTANPIVIGTTAIDFELAGTADAANLTFDATSTAYGDSSLGTALRSRGVCVTDYPFLCDNTGVDDVSTGWTDAITELTSRGGDLIVPPGTYKFTTLTGFTLPAGTRMRGYGATLDFSGASEASRIRVTGTIGSNVLLSSNVSALGTTVPVASVSGIAVDDLLLLSSDDLVPTADISGSTTETIGEWITPKSISGTTLTINGYLEGSYLTADNAKVQKVTTSDGVTIEGITIIGRGITGSDTSSAEVGISATYARKLVIRDVTIKHCDYQAISIDQCYDWLIENPTIIHEQRASTAHTAVIQYGIAPKNASSIGRIVGGRIVNGKHGVAWTENSNPGIGRDVTIDGVTFIDTWAAAIATHESSDRYRIVNNNIVGCERGMDLRVPNGLVSGNKIRNIPSGSTTGEAFYLSGDARDIRIVNNEVDGCRYGVRGYDVGFPSGANPRNLFIRGNTFKSAGQIAVYLEHTENTNSKLNVVIEGNDILDFGTDGVRLNGTFTGPKVRHNTFACASTPAGYGVRLMGTIKARETGNDFTNMVPVRLEHDTQSVPAAPSNPILLWSTWDHTSAFSSVSTGTDVVRQDNVEIGTPQVTIASGAITVPAGVKEVRVDTEGSAASDDLDTINGTSPGDVVILRAANDARTVVAKDGTGNCRLSGDFSMDHTDDRIVLMNVGGVLFQLSTSNNAT